MANSRTPAEFKNSKFENPSPLFRPLAQYLGSDKRRVLTPCVTFTVTLTVRVTAPATATVTTCRLRELD